MACRGCILHGIARHYHPQHGGAGNLGGTVGPYFFGAVREWTGSFTLALTVGGISLIIGSLIAMPIRQRRNTP